MNELKEKVKNTSETGVFLVKSKGLQEQFSNLDVAKRAYGALKNKKKREGENFKIELLRKIVGTDNWEVMDMIKISSEE